MEELESLEGKHDPEKTSGLSRRKGDVVAETTAQGLRQKDL